MKLKCLLVSAALAATPAISQAQAGVKVAFRLGPPPHERFERLPPPPSRGWIWVHGHWTWRRRHWIWLRGFYQAPRPGMAWIPGRWESTAGGYVWIKGRWIPSRPEPVFVAAAPPAPRAEPPPPQAPGPGYFWVRGHWAWRSRWDWLPGRYVLHPHDRPGAHWVDGRWEHRARGWIWVEGRWE